MKNILLTIAYDGSDYHGWQRQAEARTAQGELERALSFLLKEEVSVAGTSRTDSGVHAYGQRASFMSELKIPIDNLQVAINNLLPDSMRIVDVEEKPLTFHARFNSIGKTYIYKIHNGDYNLQQDLFMRNHFYHVLKKLDISAMQQATAYLVGAHDFASFQAAGGMQRETTVRTVKEIIVEKSDEDGVVEISITGDGFLYNMVRIIVGTLVEVGIGKTGHRDLQKIIEAKDRSAAGHTAPPGGLYLKEIYYE